VDCIPDPRDFIRVGSGGFGVIATQSLGGSNVAYHILNTIDRVDVLRNVPGRIGEVDREDDIFPLECRATVPSPVRPSPHPDANWFIVMFLRLGTGRSGQIRPPGRYLMMP
jgi:hypothetical protein